MSMGGLYWHHHYAPFIPWIYQTPILYQNGRFNAYGGFEYEFSKLTPYGSAVCLHLDEVIMDLKAAVDLMPVGDPCKPEQLSKLARLLMRRFESKEAPEDLDQAINNQQTASDLTPADDSDKPEQFEILAGLHMRRFERKEAPEDLEQAIKNQQTAVVLTPADDEYNREKRLEELKRVRERRLQMVGNSEIGSSLLASVTVPTTRRGERTFYEVIKDKLFEDLQQLSKFIKTSKHRELSATIRRMENAVLCLEVQDGDQLCHDIFKSSTRLGAYCQALRNRAGDETNQEELEDLYKEFIRIEKEFSAAHDRINSKYERLYKQWKAERKVISKFLSKTDWTNSQSANLEVRAVVEQVDAGFERIGDVLKNEANDLNALSETLARLSKLVHPPPDLPIVSSDPTQILPDPPDSSPTPTEVSTQVDGVITTISQVDALVAKSRYNKARKIVSKSSFKTTQKLKKLRTSAEDYDEENQTLSCLQTCHTDHSRDMWNRQRKLCSQLSNIVGGMRRMLKGIEKGFSDCKASIQGLVFRPLGDLLCDLEPFLSRAGFEISNKGLHADLILYEAAFQAIAGSILAHLPLLERVKGSLSALDKLRWCLGCDQSFSGGFGP